MSNKHDAMTAIVNAPSDADALAIAELLRTKMLHKLADLMHMDVEDIPRRHLVAYVVKEARA